MSFSDLFIKGKKAKIAIFMLYSYFCGAVHILANILPWPIRNLIVRPLFLAAGRSLLIDYGCYFRYPWRISIGEFTTINRGCSFYPGLLGEDGFIKIGNRVSFGPEVKLFAAGHDYSDLNLADVAIDIIICDDVWIGGNSVVLPGVHIGRGCIVGAGSVVTRSLPPYSVAVGSPAKIIKKRIINNN